MQVILFDGVCNLCNGYINWIIDRDNKNQFQFASLQSQYGIKKVTQLGLDNQYLGTVILIDEKGVAHTHSTAVLKIVSSLGGIYSGVVLLRVFPKFIRDYVYNIVAANRYKWFGKQDSCRIPTPALKAKFLDDSI